MKISVVDPWCFTPPYNRELCAALAAIGHEVTLIGQHHGDGESLTTKASSAVATLGLFTAAPDWLPRSLALVVKGLQHVRGMCRLYARLRSHPPDVIHFQWLPLPLIDALFVPLLRRIAPVVLTIHDSNPYNGAGPWLLRAGNMLAIRCCDHLIVHNRLSERRMIERGLPAKRIHRIAHGLLNQHEAADRMTDNDRVRFLQFGKIKDYKGVDILLKAIARLDPECRKRCHVSIVGRAYIDTAPLIRLVERHDLRGTVDLRFDFVSDTDMALLFEAADFLVFPYRGIDTSGVLMAAIARGIPVVASDIGCFAEMLSNGEEGVLVPPGDSEALAGALASLIRSPETRDRMRVKMQALRQRVPSWRHIAETTAAVYELAQMPPASKPVRAVSSNIV